MKPTRNEDYFPVCQLLMAILFEVLKARLNQIKRLGKTQVALWLLSWISTVLSEINHVSLVWYESDLIQAILVHVCSQLPLQLSTQEQHDVYKRFQLSPTSGKKPINRSSVFKLFNHRLNILSTITDTLLFKAQ